MVNILRRISLTQWIVIAMAIGVLTGWLFPEFSQNVRIVSNIFLRMIKSIIVPLLFGTLVMGIAGHGDDLRRVGRLAFRSIVYFEVVTTLALVIGLVAVNLTQPGVGVALQTTAAPGQELAAKKTTVQGMIEHIVPQSVVEAAATNDVLQVVFFRDPLRRRAQPGEGQTEGNDAESLRGAVRGDVQVHRVRDEIRAARHRRRHGIHRRAQRPGRARQPRQTRADHVRRAWRCSSCSCSCRS